MPRLQMGRGVRPGTKFWRGPDRFDYHVNRVMKGGRISMRCTEYRRIHCLGRASVARNGRFFRQTTRHSHDPDRYKLQARKFRHALMERCRQGDRTRFKRMYHEVRRALRIRRQAAARIPLVNLRTSMRRARLMNLPNMPTTLKSLGAVLQDPQYRNLSQTLDGKGFLYQGKVGSARRKTTSLIFTSRKMLRYMRRVKKVFCDGMFGIRPRGMKSAQVWSIVTVRRHHVIPLVRVLMRSRKKEAYEEVLRGIERLCPRFRPNTVIMDFEGAQSRAWSTVHPNAARHGCLFHYSTDVATYAAKIGMRPAVKTSKFCKQCLRMLCAIPLLPADKIFEGAIAVSRRARRKRVMNARFITLLEYWGRTWRPKGPMLSVCGEEDRTSNASESDNKVLLDTCGRKRPGVWGFLDTLLECEDGALQDLATLKQGRQASRKRRYTAISNDEIINNHTTDLRAGDISVSRFLQNAALAIAGAVDLGIGGGRRRRRRQ